MTSACEICKGVAPNLDVPEKVEDPLQGSGGRPAGKVLDSDDQQAEETACATGELRCTSFDWVSIWKTTATSSHDGRASLKYLKEHPDESGSIHVVM